MANHSHDVDIYKHEYGYIVVCVQCGKQFDSRRYDAAFCSSTCRSRNHRDIAKLDRDIEKIKALVDDVIMRMPQRGESKAYTELNNLTARIDRALAWVEVH